MSQRTPKRKRGVVLTPEGLRRLRAAIASAEIWDNDGDRYTIEALSQRIGLDPKTIAKVLDSNQGLDKRTLEAV